MMAFASKQCDVSDNAQGKRTRTICILWILCSVVTILGMLLAAVVLAAMVSDYPRARLVASDGVKLLSECPTFGARMGSVRSPLCSWGITKRQWFETDDTINQVARWYETRGTAWNISVGRLYIRLWFAHVQPISSVNQHQRFFVETDLSINISQP